MLPDARQSHSDGGTSVMKIDAGTILCASLGNPNRRSRAPMMHNAGFSALDLPYVYLAFEPDPDGLSDVFRGMRGMGIRGFSITKPFKESVLSHLDELDSSVKRIGAANAVVNDGARLVGYNTDWIGAVEAVSEALSGVRVHTKEASPLNGRVVFVVGAGGAAKAISYGLSEYGAEVTMFNRTTEKARESSRQLGIAFGGDLTDLEDAVRSTPHCILINATSIGMANTEEAEGTVISIDSLRTVDLVFDAVITPRETTLLREAREAGCATVEGVRMLLYQGLSIFELFTGCEAPVEAMWSVLID